MWVENIHLQIGIRFQMAMLVYVCRQRNTKARPCPSYFNLFCFAYRKWTRGSRCILGRHKRKSYYFPCYTSCLHGWSDLIEEFVSLGYTLNYRAIDVLWLNSFGHQPVTNLLRGGANS